MKKLLKTGKKALSVIMAIMMVLTAWVWVAPTEASAVDSGTYDVRVYFNVTDCGNPNITFSNAKDYTGPTMTGKSAGITLYHKANNGTSESTTESHFNAMPLVFRDGGASGVNYNETALFSSVGFPDSIQFYCSAHGTDNAAWYITKITVSASGADIANNPSAEKTIWEGNVGQKYGGREWQGEIKSDGSFVSHRKGDGDWSTISDASKWISPKADEVRWSFDAPTDVNLSLTGTTEYTRNLYCAIEDQYDVLIGDDILTVLGTPISYTLKSNNYPDLNTTSDIKANYESGYDSNLYYTLAGTSTEYQLSVKVNDQLRSNVVGLNERTVTLDISCGGIEDSRSFDIYDPECTIYFEKVATDADDLIPSFSKVYYGETLASSTYPTSGNRPGHTFIGMFDAAEGGNLMNINEQVLADKTYYAHWEKLNYAAIFMDRTGENVILVENPIPYGDASQEAQDAAAKLPEIEYDNNNHYVLDKDNVWTPSTDKVTDNTFFYPNYTTVAHTFGEGEYVEATCQHGAGYVYSCTGCDYYYVEETSSTTISHIKSENYVVDKEATCTTEGKGHYYCVDCGTELDSVTIEATHSYQSEITKEATCQETGLKVYTCTKCDFVAEETIPLLPHSYEEGTTVAATCALSGYTVMECQNVVGENGEKCGHTYKEYKGDATKNHVWEFAATENTDNNTVYVTGTCTECGTSFTTDEFELSHKHKFTDYEITAQPTCKVAGEIKISCADAGCDESYIATIPAVATAHAEYETTVTPATCGKAGSVVTKCKNCGETISTTEIAALKHSYDYVRVEPTCTTAGSITKTCANCGDVQTDAIPATGHKTVIITANCQQGGIEKCGVCSEVISTTVKTAHDFSGEVKEVAATCTADGLRITKCANCDAYDVITLGKTGHKIPAEWTVITPDTCELEGYETKSCDKCNTIIETRTVNVIKDHDYSVVTTVDATCTQAGKKTTSCALCGEIEKVEIINPVPHTYNNEGAVVETKATCTSGAHKTYNCDKCDYSYIEVIDNSQALGHDWDEGTKTEATCTSGAYITYTCQREGCKETKVVVPENSAALGHDFSGTESNVVDATCTKDGSKTVKCIRCDKTTGVIIPHKGHTWGNWNITTPATNTTPGEMTRTCSNNKCTDTVVIPAGGHIWDNGTETLAPTCTKTGTIVYKCTAHANCGVKIEVTLPMLQHNYTTEYVDSTCDRAGYIRTSCTVCKKLIVDKSISPKAHTFDNGTKYPATCTDAAYHLYQCINTDAQGKDNCNYSYKAFAGGTDAALGHNLVAGETTATCEGTGSQIFYCDRENCGYSTSVEMPALGHNYVEEKQAATTATCKTPATKTYKCSRCTDSYTVFDGEKSATHNAWSAWTIVEATNTSLGYKTRTCNTCGQVEFEIIPATGEHNFNDETTDKRDATCTEDGYIVYACSTDHNCGLTSKVTIPATGHTEAFEYKAATCSKDGFAKMYCSTCTTVLSEQKIDMLGCDWVQGEVTSSTCSTKGSIAYECSRCGSDKSVELSTNENAHQYETKVTNATCYKEGSVVTKCKLCQNKLSEETLIKTEHTWDDGTETTPATCTTKGEKTYKCTVEGCTATKTEPIDALGHDWTAWTVSKAPTANSTGESTRTCLREGCSMVETLTIPALGESVSFTVSFVVDGKLISTQKVSYGSAATAPKVAVKAPDADYHYSFSWDTDFAEVTADLTVNGIYTATGHTYGEWITDIPAGCNNSGLRHRVCACEYIDEDVVAKLSHDFSEVIEEKPATCTENGYRVVVCKNCGAEETQTLKRLGHSMTYYSGYAATCDSEGIANHYNCSRCGKDFEDKNGIIEITSVILVKKYHTFVVVDGSTATCTSDGVTDYKFCTMCGYVQHSETIPAYGHTDADGNDRCDRCGILYENNGALVCSCNCHKKGTINELFYKILLFFWKLFGINKSCDCGTVHY